MNVKIVKLINSEEILCDVISQDDKLVTVKHPSVLVPHNNNVAMAPYLPFADLQDKVLEIPSSQVMFTVDANPKVAEQYEQQFNPNPIFAPADKKIIAPGGPLGLAH